MYPTLHIYKLLSISSRCPPPPLFLRGDLSLSVHHHGDRVKQQQHQRRQRWPTEAAARSITPIRICFKLLRRALGLIHQHRRETGDTHGADKTSSGQVSDEEPLAARRSALLLLELVI